MASAITALVCGGIGIGCSYYAQSIERKRAVVAQTPLFTTIPALSEFVRLHGAREPGAPQRAAAYVSLDAYSATNVVGGIIVRDCEISEVTESWTYTPASAAAVDQANPPGEGRACTGRSGFNSRDASGNGQLIACVLLVARCAEVALRPLYPPAVGIDMRPSVSLLRAPQIANSTHSCSLTRRDSRL
jgi:hypothetical protein